MMTVVHVSFARSSHSDPEQWLRQLYFYTGVPEAMSKRAIIKSIHPISYNGVLGKNGVEYHFIQLTALEVFYPVRIFRMMKSWRPAVTIVHGMHFPWQVFLLHLFLPESKIVLQHHAERPQRLHKKFWQHRIDKFVSAYFFSSRGLADPWLSDGQIRKPEKIHEIPEVSTSFVPIDLDVARRATNTNGCPSYLWVGRLDENKDPLTLLKGFVLFVRHHSDARLTIVYRGGDLAESFRTWLLTNKEAAPKIEIHENIDHEKMLPWFSSADFIISTSHYEGSGTAVTEGLACGCVPILSDIPSFRSITGGGTIGRLFDAGNAEALAECLEGSLKIDLVSEREKVKDHFQRHLSFEAIAEGVMRVINEITA